MDSNKRKILLVCKNIPYPPYTGGDVRIFNLLKRISLNYEASLICMSDAKLIKNAENLNSFCKKIYIVPIVTGRTNIQKILLLSMLREWPRLLQRLKRLLKGVPFGNLCFYHPNFRDKLREVLRNGQYNIVQFEFIVTGQYLTDVKEHLKGAKSIIIQHGMIAEELKRMAKHTAHPFRKIFYIIESILSEKYEKKILPQFDHVVSMSEIDKQKLIDYGLPANEVTTIKSGVDTDELQDTDTGHANKHLVFLGTMKYLANRDGLVWFLDNVYPIIKKKIPDTTLAVIGEQDPRITEKYAHRSIIFQGVLENLESAMGKGMIFIAPIRIGTGTRLKIVTAMAFGMPVVSTSVGIEGIEASEAEGAIIADTERDFAHALIDLLENREKRYRLGETARRFVEREYTWDIIAKDLFALYEGLLRGSA